MPTTQLPTANPVCGEAEPALRRGADPMISVDGPPRSGFDVLHAVQHLTPTIAARAAEIESGGRVPLDLLHLLVDAGCFRMLLPPSHGGVGADLPTAMHVLETLATADASVAWISGIGATTWLDLVGLPPASFDRIVGTAPDVILAGVFRPAGTAIPVDGGYRVSGRWSFASGCEHATWIYGNCIEIHGGTPSDGAPGMRIAVFSPSEITIEDTWHVSGLRGTGSHHIRVDDVFVPVDRTLDPLEAPPSLDEPITRAPLLSVLSLAVTSIALGVARAALDDIVAIAAGKVPMLAAGALATNPLFQYELATAETELGAARALTDELATATWDAAVRSAEPTMGDRATCTGGERMGDGASCRHRRHGVPQRWRHDALQRSPAPASAPRRARHHAALPRHGRHAHHRRCRLGPPGSRRCAVLTREGGPLSPQPTCRLFRRARSSSAGRSVG